MVLCVELPDAACDSDYKATIFIPYFRIRQRFFAVADMKIRIGRGK